MGVWSSLSLLRSRVVQGQVQLFGYQLGILIEHLIEITQTGKTGGNPCFSLSSPGIAASWGSALWPYVLSLSIVPVGAAHSAAKVPVRLQVVAPSIFTWQNRPMRPASPVRRTSRHPRSGGQQVPIGSVHQNPQSFAYISPVLFFRNGILSGAEPVKPLVFLLPGGRVRRLAAGVPGRGE